MFILKLAIIILSIPFLTAIMTMDAMRYGSSILICKSEDNKSQEVVRYWTLVQSADERKILNTINKRSYKLEQCEIFNCSYNPSEMELCKLPVDPPKYKRDVERFKSKKNKEIEEKKERDAVRE